MNFKLVSDDGSFYSGKYLGDVSLTDVVKEALKDSRNEQSVIAVYQVSEYATKKLATVWGGEVRFL